MNGYDVIVIGGGIAGISASISAARLGCKVALVHNRPVLGGNFSSEIKVHITGASGGGHMFARESGIVDEIVTETRFSSIFGRSVWLETAQDIVLLDMVKQEPGIELFLDTEAKEAIMEDSSRIRAIRVESEKGSFTLSAPIFIDCSGDGVIAYSAGAEYRMGREGKEEFGESLAPDKPDGYVLGSSLMFTTKELDHPVKFTPPGWAYRFEDKDLPYRSHSPRELNYWWIEYGGMLDTIKDNDRIKEELTKILFGVWDHIKNRGNHRAENFILDWIGQMVGKRESRRFIGDYILTQKDLEDGTLFPDRVAYGGWSIDLHPPAGIFDPGHPCEQYKLPDPYSIPFRSLYSENIENLMFAGRNISASHVALGSTRVQGTCGVMGQAAGTAAYLCKKYDLMPRDIYKNHIKELQQLLLREDCYIIGIKNEDPEDIARISKVSASSSRKLEIENFTTLIPLNSPIGESFMVTDSRIDDISLYFSSTREREIVLSLYKVNSLRDINLDDLIATSREKLEANFEGWIDFPVDRDVNPGYYLIKVEGSPDVYIGYNPRSFPGIQRIDLSSKFNTARGVYPLRLNPPSKPYGPENIINGISRPTCSAPNLWISEEGFPQSVDLDFPEPQRINTIYITFDTNLDTPEPFRNVPEPECVRDYAVYYKINGNLIKLLEERGNYHRRRVHRFNEIECEGISIEVLSTNGDPYARIYEIRIYRF
ncbi:MAG: FAD-dependent oxidoreductase [Dictyoglomi bacterium]|nr:FAD-dependent oxidoreductase [Dictyoglomota bacterium]